MKKTFLPFFVLLPLFFSGCYSVKYLPYSGSQQDWPTSAGSFMAPNMPLPVYYGYPSKPYAYLAQIEVFAKHPSVDVVKVAAQEAKTKGADALLIIEDTQRPIGTTSFGSGTAFAAGGNTAFGVGNSYGSVQYGGQTKVIAIKWK